MKVYRLESEEYSSTSKYNTYEGRYLINFKNPKAGTGMGILTKKQMILIINHPRKLKIGIQV